MANDFSGSDAVAWWLLNETSSNRADSSGNGNTLEDNNTVSYGTGDYYYNTTEQQSSNCADFESTSQEYLDIANSSLDSSFPIKSGGSGTFSLCFWMKVESAPAASTIISKYDYNVTSNRTFLMRFNNGATGIIETYIGISGSPYYETLDAAYQMSANRWYHIGFTFNNTTKDWKLRIWDDTTQTVVRNVSSTASNNIQLGSASFAVGAAYATGSPQNYLDAMIDEVVVFDTEISTTDIDDIRNGDFGAVANKVFHLVATGSGIGFSQDSLESGATYKYSIDIKTVTSGGIQLKHGSTVIATYTTTGVKTGTFTASSATFSIVSSAACDLTFDDVDISQILAPSITQYSPTISQGVTVDAGTQSLTITQYAETVIAGASVTVDAGVQALTLTPLGETTRSDCTYQASQLSLLFTNFGESVVTGTVITPSSQSLTFTINAATYTADATHTPSVQALTFTSLGETVLTGNDILVEAGTQTVTITQYSEQEIISATYTAGLQTLTLTNLAETTRSDVTFTASTLSLTLTNLAETVDISAGVIVYPTCQTLNITTNEEAITTTCTVDAGVQSLIITYNQESVLLGTIVPAGFQTLSVAVNGVTTRSDAVIDANLQTLLIVQLQEIAGASVSASATLQTLTTTIHSASVFIDADISANVLSLTLVQYPALIVSPNNVVVLAETIPMVFSRHYAVPLNVTYGNVKTIEFSSRSPSVEISGRAPTVEFSTED